MFSVSLLFQPCQEPFTKIDMTWLRRLRTSYLMGQIEKKFKCVSRDRCPPSILIYSFANLFICITLAALYEWVCLTIAVAVALVLLSYQGVYKKNLYKKRLCLGKVQKRNTILELQFRFNCPRLHMNDVTDLIPAAQFLQWDHIVARYIWGVFVRIVSIFNTY